MKVSELIARFIEKNKIRFVFGIPGTHILPFVTAFYNSRTKLILTKHESGASFMADGYSKVSGRIGVCFGTTGPGATNLITGVATSYMDSMPILALTAAVPTKFFGKGALQEGTGIGRSVGHLDIFKSITKHNECVMDPKDIKKSLEKSYNLMLSRRPGPVHLDLPVDVQNSRVRNSSFSLKKDKQEISRKILRRTARILAKAKNPVVLAGGGVVFSDASYLLRDLSDTLRMPVATTVKGKGAIDEDSELALGTVGLYGSSVANSFIRDKIDVMLALGCSFHEFSTQCYDERIKPKKLIHVDIDEDELNKNYKAHISISADAKEFLKSLLTEIKGIKADRSPIISRIKHLKKKYRYFNEKMMHSDAVPIKPQRAMKELREILPRDTIVFSESIMWTQRYFKVHEPKTHIVGTGLASLGYGTAACIGGKLAAPDKPVICICGDGGFQFMAMEVKTAVTYEVPVVWIILNNSRFGVIYNAQKKLYNGRFLCSELENPDFMKFAESMGAVGSRIRKPCDIKAAVNKALKKKKPAVIEIIIDPDEAPPNKLRILEQVRASKVDINYLKNLKGFGSLLREK